MDHEDTSYSYDHATQNSGNDQYNNNVQYNNHPDPTHQQFDPPQPEPASQPMPAQQQQPPQVAVNFMYPNGGPVLSQQPPNFPPQIRPQPVGQYPPQNYQQVSPPNTNGTHTAGNYQYGTTSGPQTVNFPPTGSSIGQMPHMNNGVNFPPTGSGVGQMPPMNNGVQWGQNVQPMMIQPQLFVENWRTGLFDCMDDPMSAVITAFCPCVTFGQVAEILDNGQTSCATSGMLFGLVWFFLGLPCIMSCTYRTKLRNKFGLVESPAPDWVTHFLCDCCAICQEYRELQLRGLDPSIGWQGNVAKVQAGFLQQQANMNAPPNQQMMH